MMSFVTGVCWLSGEFYDRCALPGWMLDRCWSDGHYDVWLFGLNDMGYDLCYGLE